MSHLLETLRRRLIVSCQAWDDDPFYGPGRMELFARAAVSAGAAGIRANGPEDVRAIKTTTGVPVIAIQKRVASDGRILITPTFEDAAVLAEAGADAIALDCTARGNQFGALERLSRITRELRLPAAADIATLDEALAAEQAGAAFVLTTMRGYTSETAHVKEFQPAFVAEVARKVSVPVFAEGRIWSVAEAHAAFEAGAFAVVVGSAITRPRDITARFTRALQHWSIPDACYLGLDLGGTNIKSGIVLPDGRVVEPSTERTRVQDGRDGILDQLQRIASRLGEAAASRNLTPLACGIATAGWPDPATGRIVYGTGNLPEWTGAPVGESVARSVGVPVFAENDVNAAALGEKYFGAAQDAETFICVALGTGVGGGIWAGGRILRGSNFQAGALGHVLIEPRGHLCTCGRRGCLEPYANAAALLRYAPGYRSVQDLISSARDGEPRAEAAVARIANYLTLGLDSAIQLIDPGLIVLAGGIAADNPTLAAKLAEALAGTTPRWSERRIEVRLTTLGYHCGVVGAGAVARNRLSSLA